jgi:hypothetical protein
MSTTREYTCTYTRIDEKQREREREEGEGGGESLKMHDGIFFIRGPITGAPHLESTYRARI